MDEFETMMHDNETSMILDRDFGPEEQYVFEPEYDEEGHCIRLKRVKK